MNTQLKSVVQSGLALALIAAGCSDSSNFKSQPPTKSLPKALEDNPTDATPDEDSEPTTKDAPVASANQGAGDDNAPELSVKVLLPFKEIRSGNQTMQVTALVKGTANSQVAWAVKGPAGMDSGSIDSNGLYTSPTVMLDETKIIIVATLLENPKVYGLDDIRVIPPEQIFIGCKVGSKIFPIIADVYRLPVDTQRLPDFTAIANDRITTVCMDQYNVPPRNFTEGFPGVPGLFEWFGLHSTGKITVPKAGTYSFRLNSDDGAILFIDGNVVINNDGQHRPTALDGNIDLTPGTHDVILDYFQGPADNIALELFWKIPGTQDFIIVPSSSFQK